MKGGFRTKLGEIGQEGFVKLLAEIEERLRPILKRSQGAKAYIYVSQRHYKSQRSAAELDARLEADLRTGVPGVQAGIKYQPQWIDAIFDVLVHKKSNLQLGIEVRFSYDCPLVRSAEAVDLFADSWKALMPFISFVVQEK